MIKLFGLPCEKWKAIAAIVSVVCSILAALIGYAIGAGKFLAEQEQEKVIVKNLQDDMKKTRDDISEIKSEVRVIGLMIKEIHGNKKIDSNVVAGVAK